MSDNWDWSSAWLHHLEELAATEYNIPKEKGMEYKLEIILEDGTKDVVNIAEPVQIQIKSIPNITANIEKKFLTNFSKMMNFIS